VPELDAEGRAIVTVHDTLAIVNVYVPNDGAGSKRLPFKVHTRWMMTSVCFDLLRLNMSLTLPQVAFLEALRGCMARLRKQGGITEKCPRFKFPPSRHPSHLFHFHVTQHSGLHVILVGDLNIARRAEDVVWKSRSLHIPTLLQAADDAYYGRSQPPVGPCTHCAGMGCW
jgi:hypothetical protein